MSRRSKALVAVLLALSALSGLAAASAQAGQFKAGVYPSRITSGSIGFHEIGTELGTLECEAKGEGLISAASSDLLFEPSFGKCQIGAKKASALINGCEFKLHAGATLASPNVEGSMDVVCPAGNTIDFSVNLAMVCHLLIPEQVGLNVVTLIANTAVMPKDVEVEYAIEGLRYELTNTCPFVGVFENGSYFGSSTVIAENGGAAVSFSVE